MLFLAMYTFVIVMMRLCGKRNTSPKMKQRNDTNPHRPAATDTQRQSRDILKFIYSINVYKRIKGTWLLTAM